MPLSSPLVIAIKLSLRVFWLTCSFALSYWLYLQWQAMPPRMRPAAISMTLPKGQSVTLGQRELASPLAEREHLRLTHREDGEWQISNISQIRRLELSTSDKTFSPHSLPLIAGQELAIAGERWQVISASPVLEIATSKRNRILNFDGATLAWKTSDPLASAGVQVPPACANASWSDHLRSQWNQLLPARVALNTRLFLGGTVNCGLNVPVDGLPLESLAIRRTADGFVLDATPLGSRSVCIAPDHQGSCSPNGFLHDNALSLCGVSHLVAGRTRFAVQPTDTQLILTPLNRSLWLAPEIATERQAALRKKGIEWTPHLENGWQLPNGLLPVTASSWETAVGMTLALFLGALLLTRIVLKAVGYRLSQISWAQTGFIALTGCWLLLSGLAWWIGTALGPLLSLAILGGSTLLVGFAPHRTLLAQWLMTITGMLVLYGVAAQFTLGQQAPDSGGWVYFQKFSATASLLFSTCTLWLAKQALPKSNRQPLHPSMRREGTRFRWHEGAIWLIALLALALLLTQLMVGAEEGVFGFQPVEFAKFALIITTAHVFALLLEYRKGRGFWRRFALWLQATLPITLLLALVVLSLVLLQDYSPVVLLCAWVAGVLVAWVFAARSIVILATLLLAGAAAFVAFDWIQNDNGQMWLAAHGFYPERFAVWLDPTHYPHSGEQIQRASELIAAGGYEGSRSVQGWSVPAIQSDFTPAWFIARFGSMVAASLMLMQALWIGTLLSAGWQALIAARAGDYVHAWQQRLRFFALWGFAGLMAGHFMMSWGTNLGWLPVMGQPMPLLATGSSLPLLLLLPMLMVCIPPAREC